MSTKGKQNLKVVKTAPVKENSVDKAKRVIIEERNSRENICLKELQEVMKKVLAKHKCDMLIEVQTSGNVAKPGLRIISK